MQITELANKIKSLFTHDASLQGKGEVTAPLGNVQKVKHWYAQRYDNLVMQRNVLLLLLIGFLLLSIISVLVVVVAINAKQFDPFVIQIDDVTGMAKIVTSTSSSKLQADDALAQYFIKQYILARETYNPVDYNDLARQKIRLFSSYDVYWQYRGYIKNPAIDPVTKYGQKNTTFLVLKSWSKLAENKYIVRFSINETAGKQKIMHKIAIVEYKYIDLELTEAERDVNPVGFQVINYRVDDDSS
jgi:type IV secretion system protein VirB8